MVDVYLPSDRMTGRPRGFAFVEFTTQEEAAEAIEKFHQYELDGRKLNVNEAEDRPRRPRAPRPFNPGPPPDAGFGQGGLGGGKPFKNKGSRRGLRGRKRSL